jgi:hypothetical protein
MELLEERDLRLDPARAPTQPDLDPVGIQRVAG